MKQYKSKLDLSKYLNTLKINDKTIGFVPTMGALHNGHLSLINKCSKENDITVVSIFVNPTQFNNKNDLINYPRTLAKDLDKIKDYCDIVFIPDENEMYNEPDKRLFDFGNIDKVMEGKHRIGHFNGVAQIVSRLFDIVQPTNAYFGLKDFQQVAIIKNLVQQLDLKTNIISCKILREESGLAMSSRNERLTPKLRENAAIINKVLVESKSKKSELTVSELENWVISELNKNEFIEIEYFSIVDNTTLENITEWKDNITGCIALHTGNVRLIDNVGY